MKLLSRTSSISTLDSSGLLSPSEDRRETVIHFPSLAPSGRQYYVNLPHVGSTSGDTQDGSKANDTSTPILALVEKRRWALDGQIHCLSVTKDSLTGLPVLLVAQPGLKFVMVDHTGVMSEPLTQVQRNPKATINVGPDTPTRGAGGGDVATDIVCGTQYVDGQKKDIIGLMSMDGAFALHDLENNTVRVHDLDSTHKIFGFSKLNFGGDQLHQRHRHPHHDDTDEHHGRSRRSGRSKSSSGYGRTSRRYDDETNGESDDDGLASDEDEDEDTATESQIRQKHQGDGSEYTDTESRTRRKTSRAKKGHQPSLLIAEPYGSRFHMNDMFVGCSWSGITFFIDQEFNTAQYDFDARVCAFGAGQYAVTPGRNEPCLFYVDFEDNIYVYYNLYIQTQPSAQFQDIVKADANLIKTSQKMKQAELEEATSTTLESESTEQISEQNVGEAKSKQEAWTEQDMKDFIHDSLYNVNRYEDEYQRLSRLAEIERAKRAAFYEAEEAKEREKAEVHRRAAEGAAAVKAEADRRSSGYIDPRLRRSQDRLLSSDPLGASEGKERGHFPPEINTKFDHPSVATSSTSSTQYTRPRSQNSQQDDPLLSPVSPSSPTSPTRKGNEMRRSSLLVKDVLSTYEGQVTPPLKSPTSPTSSGHFSKVHRSGTSGGAGYASLTNITKRFSLKDFGNGGRLSKNSGTSSSGSSGSSSSNTVIASHHLLGGVVLGKGKTLETRAGKSSLRVNRPVGVPRSRSSLGVLGRKLSAKSRLSHQQDRDDGSEEVDDDGLDRTTVTSDGTEDIEREQMLEYERSQGRATIGAFDDRTDGNEADLGAQEYYNPCEGEDDHDEETNGVYTPSTISPIPSPGRFYSQQHLQGVEPSPGVDGSAFTLAKSLLSPSTKAGSLGPLPTREIVASVGISSGPNSAGHSSGNQDGRRSRAESVLSTGSDIGGVIVPDITLLASSFPTQSTIPLSTSEPHSHGTPLMPQDSDNEEGAFQEGHQHESEERSRAITETGVRRPPRRSATLGSDGGGHKSGSGSDTATGKPGSRRNSRRLADGRRGSKGDVKLMPAPLPRSSQHHQRQQEQVSGSYLAKDSINPSHISFSTSTLGGGTSGIVPGSVYGEGHEGLGRGLGGKSSSTTSSTNASEFGSGPSSPLTANVNSANAILSNPSTSSYKGFGILSLPVTSPAGSTASAHQYFSASHYPVASGKSAAQPQHSHHHPLGHSLDHLPEDDRISIRSKASSFRAGRDREDVDADSLLDHEGAGIGASSGFGLSPRSSSSHPQQHRPHYAGSLSSVGSSSHLVSDSLVHRLEELQRQDHELEEKQKRKQREKELEREREREKEREKERIKERAKGTGTTTSGPACSSVEGQ
ncbi:integrin alpha FG-GAP repeat-containing protein 2 [Podila verticillata]|nr:integrin alpha FG-GAP repeat-containing protein 2 [Podila verticillata]